MGKDIVHAIEVHQPPQVVYDLIATKAGLARFWTPAVSGEETLGGELRFGFAAAPAPLPMTVTKLESGSLVTWHCPGGYPFWQNTRVEWALQASEHRTKLVFRHLDFPTDQPEYEFGSVSLTWATIIVRLKEIAEGAILGPALR